MVRIRLRRIGFRNQPSFRIVAVEKESPRDGRFLEILGSYNPRTEPFTIDVKEDRVFDWLNKGAQPSDSVNMIFKKIGLLDRFARLKNGESLEVVMYEAQNYYKTRVVNPKTKSVKKTTA